MAVAVISLLAGGFAITVTLLFDDWRSPGTLLALVLMLNALVRYELGRRSD